MTADDTRTLVRRRTPIPSGPKGPRDTKVNVAASGILGSRTIKQPVANDELREANRLAQTKVDEFWQQNPNAGK